MEIKNLCYENISYFLSILHVATINVIVITLELQYTIIYNKYKIDIDRCEGKIYDKLYDV